MNKLKEIKNLIIKEGLGTGTEVDMTTEPCLNCSKFPCLTTTMLDELEINGTMVVIKGCKNFK